jgi:hypothetical protein
MANFPFNISKSAWKVFIAKNLPSVLSVSGSVLELQNTTGDVIVGGTGGKAGFFGKTPVTKPTAMTASDASVVDATYGAQEQAVITNLRTRVDEMETKLKALGLLT